MKLSHLEPGRGYRLTADGVDARFTVLQAGAMPVCTVSGYINSIDPAAQQPDRPSPSPILHGEDPPLVMVLLGWAPCSPDIIGPNGLVMFVLDEQPPPEVTHFLVALFHTGGSPSAQIIACSPKITSLIAAA